MNMQQHTEIRVAVQKPASTGACAQGGTLDEKLLTRLELARRWKVSIETLKRRERAKILRNISQIYLAQNRRVDITLANTGQQSAQVYPFNAHDAETLLSEKPQAHARKPAPKK